ncbi:SpoIIE family protein phosphatase [Azospirillum sp. HJ39]|uniref:PP2C family protein-serine/threonine phosphatase n=1 Tax=Azospirillum sp. HJ39 TaxID=3159496 RepID=UPI003556FB22
MSGGPRVVIGHPRPAAAGPLRGVVEGLGAHDVAVVDGDGLPAAVEEPPHLLVLHAGLPGFGPEMLSALRAGAMLRELPILVLGRFAGARQRAALMAAGATDLLARPLTLPELSARLSLHLENRKLSQSLQEMIDSLHAYHGGAVQRMALAREMQLGLLPDRALCQGLERSYGIELDSHFESSSELGGDLWGAHPLDERRFALFLYDFTGHGVAAALNTFRLHALLARTDLPADDPAGTLAALNRLLIGLLPETQFAAMVYAVVDTVADTLTYATAGAPKPLIGRPDGSLEIGPSCGVPLGVAAGATYRNHRLEFPAGSFLVLFSDALVEARGGDGRLVGHRGVADLVRGLPGLCGSGAREDGMENGMEEGMEVEGARPLARLLDRYFTTMPRPLADDLTVLWLSRPWRPDPRPCRPDPD